MFHVCRLLVAVALSAAIASPTFAGIAIGVAPGAAVMFGTRPSTGPAFAIDAVLSPGVVPNGSKQKAAN